MALSTWVADEIIPAAKLNQPVELLNEMADSGLSYMSMFQRSHLQKLAIASPQDGHYLYNASQDKAQIYINGRWHNILTEQADYDVSGTVTNTLSGAALAGVAITVNGNQTTATDGSGNYSLTNIPKGAAVSVAGSLSGYNAYASTVNLSSGNATKSFTMARRTVSGTVTSSGGGAVVGATVSIASPARSTTTDGSGNYSLIDVPDGSYTITASHADHSAYTSSTVVVTADRSFNFTMTLLDATVTGTVTSDATSLAISGASVVVDGLTAVTTNGSGVYSRSGVARLTARSVAATYSPYFSAYSGSVNVSADPTTKNFSMTAVGVASLNFGLVSWRGDAGIDAYNYVAQRITVSRTVQATAITIWNHDNLNNITPIVGQIYDTSNNLLGSTSSFNATANTTTTQALSSPVTLTPGDYWVVGYRSSSTTPGSYKLSTFVSTLYHHPFVSVYPNYYYGNSGTPSGWSQASGVIAGISLIVKI